MNVVEVDLKAINPTVKSMVNGGHNAIHPPPASKAYTILTRRVDDGEVGAVLVFDADDDLSRPELLLRLQAAVLTLNVILKNEWNDKCVRYCSME